MIKTTYGQVRRAYGALTEISREGLQIPLAAALKWKRILGILKPLVAQMEEQQQEFLEKFAQKDENGKLMQGDQPGTVRLADVQGFQQALEELNEVAVTVGSDLVKPDDFGAGEGTVSSRLVELLGELGPFFDDAPPAQPAQPAQPDNAEGEA